MYFSLALFLNFTSLVDRTITPPRYEIDLDAEPNERWTHVVKNYKYAVPAMYKVISDIVPKFMLPLVEKIGADIDAYLPPPYGQELKGIAEAAGINLGDVVLVNLGYEFTAFCTSIVSQDSNGTMWLSRNLDSDYADLIRNTTIRADFQRGGKTVYTGVTCVGYIGLMTAMKPYGFSISVDERHKGNWLENLLVAILDRRAVPISFLVRNTVERYNTFEEAVDVLSLTDTIADVYFIVAGTHKEAGAVITKDRFGSHDIWYINSTVSRWFLVETNYDHWLPPPPDDDRRDPAIRAMYKMGQKNINVENLFKVMSTPPVLNRRTAYTTIMSPTFPDQIRTWIRNPE